MLQEKKVSTMTIFSLTLNKLEQKLYMLCGCKLLLYVCVTVSQKQYSWDTPTYRMSVRCQFHYFMVSFEVTKFSPHKSVLVTHTGMSMIWQPRIISESNLEPFIKIYAHEKNPLYGVLFLNALWWKINWAQTYSVFTISSFNDCRVHVNTAVCCICVIHGARS